MDESEVMRKYAEAHGCDYEVIPVREKDGIYKRIYKPVRPVPCVRDAHGEIAEQAVKTLIAKIDEELNELKEAVFFSKPGDFPADYIKPDKTRRRISEEAADTITAITTLCNALGIDAKMRNEAQRRVNRKNLERGRL